MRRVARPGPGNLRRVQFESIFEETIPSAGSFWQQVDPANGLEAQLTILQGKLLLKQENDQWESFLFELQPEKMYRITDQQDCCYLRSCFLKKFNHYDAQYPNFKYGFRLQSAQHLAFFVTDSVEQFKKWFMMLKRFCILEKFQRKYKVIAQLKYNDPIFQQVCYNCVRLSDAQYYLVKIIPKELNSQQKQIMFKELMHLRRLNNPQLMRVIEVYEDESNVYQVFDPYMGGDLRQHLRETQTAPDVNNQIDEKVLADMMYGLLCAICHMHQKGVFHRDIKLDNLFVPENRRLPFAVLCNFCYSENFRLNGPNAGGYKKCGTPGYVAPEIFRTKNYDQKIDVFSLGVVFYILVYGRMPFEGIDQDEILKSNERCEIDFKADKKLCKAISQSALDLMKKMLLRDPAQRFSSNQCLNHHWFIKMKSKDETKPRNNYITKQRSLSTIIENSEIMELTQSFIRPTRDPSQHQMASKKSFQPWDTMKSQRNANTPTNPNHPSHGNPNAQEKVEKEFVFESLDVKMGYINQDVFQKIPSKRRRM